MNNKRKRKCSRNPKNLRDIDETLITTKERHGKNRRETKTTDLKPYLIYDGRFFQYRKMLKNKTIELYLERVTIGGRFLKKECGLSPQIRKTLSPSVLYRMLDCNCPFEGDYRPMILQQRIDVIPNNNNTTGTSNILPPIVDDEANSRFDEEAEPLESPLVNIDHNEVFNFGNISGKFRVIEVTPKEVKAGNRVSVFVKFQSVKPNDNFDNYRVILFKIIGGNERQNTKREYELSEENGDLTISKSQNSSLMEIQFLIKEEYPVNGIHTQNPIKITFSLTHRTNYISYPITVDEAFIINPCGDTKINFIYTGKGPLDNPPLQEIYFSIDEHDHMWRYETQEPNFNDVRKEVSVRFGNQGVSSEVIAILRNDPGNVGLSRIQKFCSSDDYEEAKNSPLCCVVRPNDGERPGKVDVMMEISHWVYVKSKVGAFEYLSREEMNDEDGMLQAVGREQNNGINKGGESFEDFVNRSYFPQLSGAEYSNDDGFEADLLGGTNVFFMVAKNEFEKVKSFVEESNDISEKVNHLDFLGYSPLDVAIYFKRDEIAGFLRSEGAKPSRLFSAHPTGKREGQLAIPIRRGDGMREKVVLKERMSLRDLPFDVFVRIFEYFESYRDCISVFLTIKFPEKNGNDVLLYDYMIKFNWVLKSVADIKYFPMNPPTEFNPGGGGSSGERLPSPRSIPYISNVKMSHPFSSKCLNNFQKKIVLKNDSFVNLNSLEINFFEPGYDHRSMFRIFGLSEIHFDGFEKLRVLSLGTSVQMRRFSFQNLPSLETLQIEYFGGKIKPDDFQTIEYDMNFGRISSIDTDTMKKLKKLSVFHFVIQTNVLRDVLLLESFESLSFRNCYCSENYKDAFPPKRGYVPCFKAPYLKELVYEPNHSYMKSKDYFPIEIQFDFTDSQSGLRKLDVRGGMETDFSNKLLCFPVSDLIRFFEESLKRGKFEKIEELSVSPFFFGLNTVDIIGKLKNLRFLEITLPKYKVVETFSRRTNRMMWKNEQQQLEKSQISELLPEYIGVSGLPLLEEVKIHCELPKMQWIADLPCLREITVWNSDCNNTGFLDKLPEVHTLRLFSGTLSANIFNSLSENHGFETGTVLRNQIVHLEVVFLLEQWDVDKAILFINRMENLRTMKYGYDLPLDVREWCGNTKDFITIIIESAGSLESLKVGFCKVLKLGNVPELKTLKVKQPLLGLPIRKNNQQEERKEDIIGIDFIGPGSGNHNKNIQVMCLELILEGPFLRYRKKVKEGFNLRVKFSCGFSSFDYSFFRKLRVLEMVRCDVPQFKKMDMNLFPELRTVRCYHHFGKFETMNARDDLDIVVQYAKQSDVVDPEISYPESNNDEKRKKIDDFCEVM